MNTVTYEFTGEQRRVLDRFTFMLGQFVPTHDKANLVLERRAKSGHQAAYLPYDSRLNSVVFNERNLQGVWRRIEEVRNRAYGCARALETFTREASEITAQTSRSVPVDQVDFSYFTRSPIWSSNPPRTIKALVSGLGSLFYALKGDLITTDQSIQAVYENSFGLKSVFIKEMGYRTCECHAQPVVASEMFKSFDTTPIWQINYSSPDPVIRAREYVADVSQVFDQFAILATHWGVFIEEISQSLDRLRLALSKTDDMETLGRLNFKLATVREDAEGAMSKLTHLESWLRK